MVPMNNVAYGFHDDNLFSLRQHMGVLGRTARFEYANLISCH